MSLIIAGVFAGVMGAGLGGLLTFAVVAQVRARPRLLTEDGPFVKGSPWPDTELMAFLVDIQNVFASKVVIGSWRPFHGCTMEFVKASGERLVSDGTRSYPAYISRDAQRIRVAYLAGDAPGDTALDWECWRRMLFVAKEERWDARLGKGWPQGWFQAIKTVRDRHRGVG